MKKLIILLVFSFVIFFNPFAQQNKIDSLKKVLNNTSEEKTRIKTYLKLGDVYEYQLPDTAIFYYQKALAIAEKNQEEQWSAKCSYYIGLVQMDQNNNSKALFYFQKSLTIAEKIEDKMLAAKYLKFIGIVYTHKSEYQNALAYYQKALDINEEIDNQSGVASILGKIGNVYYYQSSYKKTLEYWEKALRIKEKLGNQEGIAAHLGNIGLVYNDQRNYPKALEYYQKALTINEKTGDKSFMAANLSNMGLAIYYQNNYPKALTYFQRALKINEELDNKDYMAANLLNIGLVYSKQGKNEKALNYYQKAFSIEQELESESRIGQNLTNIGTVYVEQGNFTKALEHYQMAFSSFDRTGSKLNKAINLGLTGDLFNRKKEYDTALKYLNESLQINQEIGVEDAATYHYLTTAYWATHHEKLAASYLDTLLTITNKNILLNFTILPESAKHLYFASVEKSYWKYNSFVLKNANKFPAMTEQVYNTTVKNKGLLLKSNTAMLNAIYGSKDSTLVKAYDKWIVLKNQIANMYASGEDASVLIMQADSLEGSLVKNSNEFSDFKKTQSINWKNVQNGLKQNEVAIEFTHFPLLNPDSSFTTFTNDIQYVALVIDKSSKYPKMIPLFKEKQLEEVLGKFGGNNFNYINGIYGTQLKPNKSLYHLIWEPIESHLEGAKKVFLSPTGLLHKVSFSAIAYAQNTYLCDGFDIEIKSSTGKIVESEYQKQQLLSASLFGGIDYNTDSTEQIIWKYLEGTKTESENITAILKKRKLEVDYFSGSGATEQKFKQFSGNSNVIHIATHGFFYPDPNKVQKEIEKNTEEGEIIFRGGTGFGINSFMENPNPLMRSGLVLAGANDVWSVQNKNDSIEDGVLTAQEVSNIDLRNTELVVMSACESGLGDIQGSEGVYGLQRSFKMAGVDFIIMSLWQVPDKETEEFMSIFYKNFTKQNDIKKAFSKTQKVMRKKYDPYFWAAFVLIE